GYAALALWAGLGYGSMALRPKPEIVRRVAVIQPNVDQYRKWDRDFYEKIRSGIESLVLRAGSEKPDLILWPEASIPGWLDEEENHRWMSTLVRKAGVFELVGALAGSPRAAFNAAVLFDPQGDIVGYYQKRQLVPFGEFVPWRPIA